MLQKSAKPTNDSSSPIHRWVWDRAKDVVRETTAEAKGCRCKCLFSRPLHGLSTVLRASPSAKALGYCHSVRFADEENAL